MLILLICLLMGMVSALFAFQHTDSVSGAKPSQMSLHHTDMLVIPPLINTLRFLQSADDYASAFESVLALDEAMAELLLKDAHTLGEDYFRAYTLRSALALILVEEQLDLAACLRIKSQFQVEFALMDEVGDVLSYKDFPSMVKEAYAILTALCDLY